MAKLVFVDDVEEAAESAATLARLLGHDAQTFTDARYVVQDVLEMHPEAIFSDLSMPRVSGYELARAVRGEACLCSTFLVALTSHSDKGHRALAARAGFDMYCVKPITPAMIAEALQRAVERRVAVG